MIKVDEDTKVYNDELKGLSGMQVRFVMEYAADPLSNAVWAARRAGYKNPSDMAFKLMKNPQIRSACERIRLHLIKKIGLTKEMVLQQLMYVLTRNTDDFMDPETGGIVRSLRDLNPRAAACVDGIEQKNHYDEDGEIVDIELKLKVTPKLSAIDLAARILGMLNSSGDTPEDLQKVDWDHLFEQRIEQTKDVVQKMLELKPEKQESSNGNKPRPA